MLTFTYDPQRGLHLTHELAPEALYALLETTLSAAKPTPDAPCQGVISEHGELTEGTLTEGAIEAMTALCENYRDGLLREGPHIFYTLTAEGELTYRWDMTTASDVARLAAGAAEALREELVRYDKRAWMDTTDGAPLWTESLAQAYGYISVWDDTVEISVSFGQGTRRTVRDRYYTLIAKLEELADLIG